MVSRSGSGNSVSKNDNTNLAEVSAKQSIFRRFNIINFLYSIITIVTVYSFSIYLYNEVGMRFIGQGNIKEAKIISKTLTSQLNGGDLDVTALKESLSLIAQNNEGIQYVVLENGSGETIAALYKNDIPVPINHIAGQTDFIDKMYITRHSFTGLDGNAYYLQFAIDIWDLFSPVTGMLVKAAIILYFLLTIYSFINYGLYKKLFVSPMLELSKKAYEIITRRDLKIRLHSNLKDEYGQLYQILNVYNMKCCQLLNDIDHCCGNLHEINSSIENASKNVYENSQRIKNDSVSGTGMINEMLKSFLNISERIQNLNKQTENGAATVYQMEQVNNEVSQNIAAMGSSVEDSIKAIGQMATSIQQISYSMEQLNNTVGLVSEAIVRLDSSVASEEVSARETSMLAQELAENANQGMDSIKQTLVGYEKIKASSANVFQSIKDLSVHTRSIGNILNVIEDITSQTNLLSLNAAIIAAQAGEHGRGFAVVADEISALANRTKESTKEITAIITTIQNSTNQSIKAIEEDQQYISEGAKLGQEAANSFEILQNSARQSMVQSQKMAEATIEQASEIRSITSAIQEVAQNIREINKASHTQAQEATSMNNLAQRMANLNQQVANSSVEQTRSASEVLKVMRNISSTTAEVNQKQQEQQINAEKAVASVKQIENNADIQTRAVNDLHETILTINSQINQLSGYLGEYNY